MKERKLIREFLETMQPQNIDYSLDSMNTYGHNGHHDIDPDRDGIVNKDDLHVHFDLDGDGVVSTDDYVNHIDFHCQYPESLEHYNNIRSSSYNTVPCSNSYDSCSRHLMQNTDDIDKYLVPLMDITGSTCRESTVKSLLDVLQSLVKCGVL